MPKFSAEAVKPGNSRWPEAIRRCRPLYARPREIRGDFERDYTRIIHCRAYRRLKHKTQVFYAAGNDHICTRMEHATLVASVSHTLCNALGLNTELAKAIATGHDLGHAPFGHHGEAVLNQIAGTVLGVSFWHEGNSLRFVDSIETVPDERGTPRLLNLTYAVRDGIVNHCGELNDRPLIPRDTVLDLAELAEEPRHLPYTWEGCVVRIADRIAYLGRDLEDAHTLGFLSDRDLGRLLVTASRYLDKKLTSLNNGALMHAFMLDLVESSEPHRGLGFSDQFLELAAKIMEFSRDRIYSHERLNAYKCFAQHVITCVFYRIARMYRQEELRAYLTGLRPTYPVLLHHWIEWLDAYASISSNSVLVLYDLSNERGYLRAVLDFVAGMTDSFILRVFDEVTSAQTQFGPLGQTMRTP